MSARPISHSQDLARLAEEGYELEVRDGFLLVHHVPYATSDQEVAFGILVSSLTTAGDETATPDTHAVSFIGGTPCNRDGEPLDSIIIGGAHEPGPDLKADHQFSSKPAEGYPDYYEKVTSYVLILSAPAQALQPDVTAKTYGPVVESDAGSVFHYADTASSRAGIGVVTEKLRVGPLAIVGLGGTGSYVLDLIAKTPVSEIHLFDGDVLLTHNAFRSPGAASLADLRKQPTKVEYLKTTYSRMHRAIVAHPYPVDPSTIDELRDMAFVFICVDDGSARQLVVEKLHEWGTPFIDVGLGVSEEHGSIGGLLRVTTSTPEHNAHVENRLPFKAGPEDDYRRNIQVADLNALNGTLAVIRWKKLVGFYDDLEHEHNSFYELDGNSLINEDCG